MSEPVVHRIDPSGPSPTRPGPLWCFHCPGCGYGHTFDARWTFNGDVVRPTFAPSLLVNGSMPERRCHSFVRDGRIEFLGDCYHELRGKTVPLEPYDA
jgi:hypothetical protein